MIGSETIRGQSGFSLIEVMVTLLIASVVLTGAFQVTTAFSARNARLSAQLDALTTQDAREQLYRAMMAGFAPRIQDPHEPPPAELIFGDAKTVSGWASSEIAAGCVSTRNFQEVKFEIRESANGGALYCLGDYGEIELAAWASGQAAFDYSLDGVEWQEVWPTPEQALGFDQFERRLSGSEAFEETLLERTSLRAPLVRFRYPGVGGLQTWIARAGDTQQSPTARLESLFETAGPEFDF